MTDTLPPELAEQARRTRRNYRRMASIMENGRHGLLLCGEVGEKLYEQTPAFRAQARALADQADQWLKADYCPNRDEYQTRLVRPSQRLAAVCEAWADE